MTQKKFLTAEWRKLIMANYAIDPLILKPYLPAKTELDYWNNNCYISLVGFMFREVRIRGIKIPFHVNFPEVNLRFYVRYRENKEWKRGVVFISEIVPKPAITFIANTLYKEHYATMPMRYSWTNDNGLLSVSYHWKKKNKWNKLEVKADAIPGLLKAGSKEEFITEHFWGYSSVSASRTGEYHVMHPRWDIYDIKEQHIDCDFEFLYGNNFKFLTGQNPESIFLAEGSEIAVYQKKIL